MSFVIRKMEFVNKNNEVKERFSVGYWNPDKEWENHRHFSLDRRGSREADFYCSFLNGGNNGSWV